MVIKSHSGQALMELAIGMLTLVIVVYALLIFLFYIIDSLEKQNLHRGNPPSFDREKLEERFRRAGESNYPYPTFLG